MFSLKKNGRWTPLGRAVRVFLFTGLGTFLTFSGLTQAGETGVIDLSLLLKAAVGGFSAGIAALITFIVNYLAKDI